MIVLLFEHRFVPFILSGEKRHSIRRTRKRNPAKRGDLLSLRKWAVKAYRSPQVELMQEQCLANTPIWIDKQGIVIEGRDRLFADSPEIEQFAKSDGFESWEAMKLYRDFFYSLPFSGDFIQWDPCL